MEILDFLQSHGVQLLVIISIVGILSAMRKSWLDKLLTQIKYDLIKFIILCGSAFFLSLIFTACFMIMDFQIMVFIKTSIFNFIYSYIFYDMIKNLFFGDKKNDEKSN